jgi:hypothetical protein
MSSTSAIKTMLECLGFSLDAASYLTSGCGIDSSEEIAYLDVDTTIKGVASLGGTVTKGSRATSVTSRNNDIHVPIRAVANLKLCVYYLKHMKRVQRKPMVNTIDLVLFHSYLDQQMN